MTGWPVCGQNTIAADTAGTFLHGYRRRPGGRWLWIVTSWLLATTRALPAQIPQHLPSAQADLRVDVNLVVLPVAVTDSLGQSITGLQRENFRLFQDGVEQQIRFLTGEEVPVSICLVVDLSLSMRPKMAMATQAVASLLKSFDQEQDEFCLVVFNERPRLAVQFTRRAQLITGVLGHAKPVGRTSLLDAIHLARTEIRSAGNLRKIVVVISDGGDNHSRATRLEVLREMREADAEVYAMSVEHAGPRPVLTLEELNGPVLLEEITHETGGRHVRLRDAADLQKTCTDIARQMHNQYVIGYSPSVHDGKLHRLNVSVTDNDGITRKVFHRPEVYLPATQK